MRERSNTQRGAARSTAIAAGVALLVSMAWVVQGPPVSPPASADVTAAEPTSAASVDYFLKIEGIDGESTDDKHAGEIDVLSWSWGQENPSSGARTHLPLTIRKHVDKATPKLMLACANGQHITRAVLTARKAGADRPYFQITLRDVVVTSVNSRGSAAEPPTEEVSFVFHNITWTYTTQRADGSFGDPVEEEVDFGRRGR